MREIITLQLGQQANYLATHFWNTQESYFTYAEDEESPVDHDVHFRPGLAPDGTETFMPRTVIYDLKGAFGTMRKINALYEVNGEDEAAPQALWNTPATLHLAPPVPPSPYHLALDANAPPPRLTPSSIRFFADYSRLFYHPRSVVQLPSHDLNSSLTPFERYDTGEELFRDLDREHDLLDRDLRLFVEEADCMQGVQVFGGVGDAWGGFAARYVERVRDEYGKVGVWVWGVEGEDVGGREKRLLRLANKAHTLAEVYKHASVVVPLAVPARLPGTVRLDRGSQWHTSALLAAAVESATLPARLRDPLRRDTLGGMADVLNAMGHQNVAGLQMSFSPGPSAGDNDDDDTAAAAGGKQDGGAKDARQRRKLSEEDLAEGVRLDIRLTPSDQPRGAYARSNGFDRPRVFSQLVASRGDSGEGQEEGEDVEMDEAGRRIRRSAYEPVTKSYHTPLTFPLLSSFPTIFHQPSSPSLPTDTTPAPDDTTTTTELTTSLNTTTSLSTDSSIFRSLKGLRESVIRSIGIEDRETLGNELMEMADEYHEGWSSGSDDGEDD